MEARYKPHICEVKLDGIAVVRVDESCEGALMRSFKLFSVGHDYRIIALLDVVEQADVVDHGLSRTAVYDKFGFVAPWRAAG